MRFSAFRTIEICEISLQLKSAISKQDMSRTSVALVYSEAGEVCLFCCTLLMKNLTSDARVLLGCEQLIRVPESAFE